MTDSEQVDGAERQLAADLFNEVWLLLDRADRSIEDDDRLVHTAHAARHHWGEVGTAVHRSRGEWQCSRVYSALGRGEPALHHARRCLAICQDHALSDRDVAFAYEALARACAVAGDPAQARSWTEQALAAAENVTGVEDRALLLDDLATIPGQPRFW